MIQRTATIANGQTSSDEIDLRDAKIITIYMPAAFDGTTMTFTTAPTAGGTHVPLTDDAGTAISITVAVSQAIVITDSVKSLAVAGLAYTKLVSGSSETAERTIQVTGLN